MVHGVLLVVLMALSVKPDSPQYLGPLLVIAALWGLGTALNKTGVSSECRQLFLSFILYRFLQNVSAHSADGCFDFSFCHFNTFQNIKLVLFL